MSNDQVKLCDACGETKPLSEFHKNKAKKDGVQLKCKCCAKLYSAVRYIENKDSIDKQQREEK